VGFAHSSYCFVVKFKSRVYLNIWTPYCSA